MVLCFIIKPLACHQSNLRGAPVCGIVGFIGKPSNPKICYDLTTALLVKTQSRGVDASGFWASDDKPDDEGAVYWSKAPIPAIEFVKTDAWKAIQNESLNLLVSHCRRSSLKGSENRNRNNHPFLSNDSRTALVHNGSIPEFDSLRQDYDDIMSECDSEILLRMLERGAKYDNDFLRTQLSDLKNDHDKPFKDCSDEEIPVWAHNLLGLVDIYARINYGAMAVAVGERWEDGTRALWLFRDKERPLQVIDVRKTLNQVYVVSEKSIWRDAVEATPAARNIVKGSTPIIEFPPNYIWLLTLSPKGETGVRKFRINRQKRNDATFESERPKELLRETITRKPIRVVTNLSHEDHEIRKHVQTSKPAIPVTEDGGPTLSKNSTEKKSLQIPSKEHRSNTVNSAQATPSTISHGKEYEYDMLSSDCFEFMWGYMAINSEPVPKQPETRPDHLRATYKSSKIPNPACLAVSLKKDDYMAWAKALKEEFDWYDRRNGNGGGVIGLWACLEIARETWLKHITKNMGEDSTAKAIEKANAELRSSFEEVEEDDDQEVDIGIVKNHDENEIMAFRKKEGDKLNQFLVDEFQSMVQKIREDVDNIDMKITRMLKEESISEDTLQEMINVLKDTSDDLSGAKFYTDTLDTEAAI